MQGLIAPVQVHLQARRPGAGLQGVFDQIEQGAHQGVAIAQQLTEMAVALPAHAMALDMGLGCLLQRLEQSLGAHAVAQRQFAASEHQHVTDLMLQLVQALLEAAGEALAGFFGQFFFSASAKWPA